MAVAIRVQSNIKINVIYILNPPPNCAIVFVSHTNQCRARLRSQASDIGFGPGRRHPRTGGAANPVAQTRVTGAAGQDNREETP